MQIIIMKIVYSGKFLLEGLREQGHSIVDISVEGRQSSDAWIKKISKDADLVLLELYGGKQFPKGIGRSSVPVACYCIDTPINEFWLQNCAAQCAHIFVDQFESVQRFAKYGLKSAFLPLAANKDWFIEPQEKKYDITFVGTVDKERIKRKNLLKHIGKYFNINIASNLSFQECQKIFAQSRIVLNENFFNGLTLRVFQGMASGSLLFTEAGSSGIYDSLNAEDSYIGYDPDNIVILLKKFLQKPYLCNLLGQKAQQNCGNLHTVAQRAEELLQKITSKEAFNSPGREEERFFKETAGTINYILRFGGNLGEEIKNLKIMTSHDNEFSAKAKLVLGKIYALLCKFSEAGKYINEAYADTRSFDAALYLALFELSQNRNTEAEKVFISALESSNEGEANERQEFKFKDRRHNLYGKIASLQLARGEDLNFGFKKPMENPLSETAFETGKLLWKENAGVDSLEIMRRSLSPYGIEGELLPWLSQAYKSDMLNRKQILKSAEIAKSYYDFELAAMFMKGMEGGVL